MSREERFLRMLGANRLFSGYEPLILCIRLAAQDENRLLSLERKLYPAVAAHFHMGISAMKRNMSTLIRHCWLKSNPRLWESIAGCPMKEQPTLGEFIDLSVCYIKQTCWQNSTYLMLISPATTRS